MKKLLASAVVILIGSTVFAGFIPANPGVTQISAAIIRSDDKTIVVDYSFPGINTEIIRHDGEVYHLLTLEGEGAFCMPGAPQAPAITRLFAIPDQAGVKLKSIVPQYKIVEDIYPYPFQDDPESPEISVEWKKDEYIYNSQGFFPEQWVTIGDPAILRDLRVVPVTVAPVRVDASQRTAQILTNLHLEIEFDNSPSVNSKYRHFNRGVSSFNNLYSSVIENYDWITPNGEDLKGSLLIIYPDAANVEPHVQQLAEWRQRTGYHVHLEEVHNGSTTGRIHHLIQNAYDNYYPPLEAVILIGDAAGAIDLSCYTYGSSNGSSDHQYTLLEGDDVLADISLGRISVGNSNELLTAVNKILYYEKTPSLTMTDWYDKGGVVATSSSSGISTIQVNQVIREWWLEDGLAEVDTMWWNMPGSMVAYFMSTLNEGVSLFNARGYLGLGGISQTHVMQLTNSGKLPFAVLITCGTGDFGSASADLSESFLRAGTPNNPTGGIGCVGEATSSNHTRFNNAYVSGVWQGFHQEGMIQLGPLTFRGKYEVFLTYQNEESAMNNNIHWINLMGDPVTELRTAIPQLLTVTHPDTIAVGASSFSITVTDNAGNPLEDRYVCLWKDEETFVGGRTDASGYFTSPVNIDTEGIMKLTVTYYNDYPYLADIAIIETEVYPSFNSVVIDDDITGLSYGNDDGFANPSEIIELEVSLMNFGTSSSSTGITATLSSTDESVQITGSESTYPDLLPGANAFGDISYTVALGNYFTQGYLIPFTLIITSNEGDFISAFDIPVNSGTCEIAGSEYAGHILPPGEEDEVILTLLNTGLWELGEVTCILSTSDPQITIIDGEANFGDILPGMEGSNSGNPYLVRADEYATEGRTVEFDLLLTSANGFEQELSFEMEIGEISTSDPIGPDEYGYYCIDNTDVYYHNHPHFEWVEIDPRYGGSGTEIDLPDYGDQQDCSRAMSLPFEFTFYGQSFDTITVCSNGWLALGNEEYHAHFSNYPLPSSFGPNSGMICAYWDDLIRGNGGVYAFFDSTNNTFTIEYSRMDHRYSGIQDETFEIILYDPIHYSTPTGDGEILINFFHETRIMGQSVDNDYFTTGIQNNEHTVGLQYAYWDEFHPGAADIEAGRSIKFTTLEPVRFAAPTSATVLIEPVNPPIIIPSAGGNFIFDLELTNPDTQYTVFDIWTEAILPDSSEVETGLFLLYELAGGQTDQYVLEQRVPGRAPEGEFTYTAYIGDYHETDIWDESSFNFTKTGFDYTGSSEWRLIGWDNELSQEILQLPSEFELYPAYPNPFNPTATLSFNLPSAADVRLTIYDITGREVAALVNGHSSPGQHSVVWDAEGLSSGMYFVRLEAGDFMQTRKLLLVK